MSLGEHSRKSLRDKLYSTRADVSECVIAYREGVPKLWNETIESHRRAVRQAILDATWALVTERGLLSVTMSQIAKQTGIGRATLYKYFPDVEAILLAHHERHIDSHLDHLKQLRDQTGAPGERLTSVLSAFALISYHRERHGTQELVELLHRGEHVIRAEQQVRDLLKDLLIEAAKSGDVRHDVSPDELASYCLHALTAAGGLASEEAVRRLVDITLDGLRARH